MTSADSLSAQARKTRTRGALRAAMLALLAEKPFEQIQITDLTQRAKVGYATFFRHYESTEALLHEIAGDEIRTLLGMTIPAMLHYDSSVSLRALCGYVLEKAPLWRPLLTGGAAHTVRAEFIRQAREWASNTGGEPTAVPVDLGTVCAAGSTIDALGWWLERTDSYSIDAIAEYINELAILPFVGDRRHRSD